MDTIGLWLIPLIMILLIGGVYLLVRRWIHFSQSEMTDIGARLRRFSADLARLSSAAQDFSKDDPGPYATPAGELSATLERLQAELQEHTALYTLVRQAMRAANASQVETIVRGPFTWFEIRRMIAQLETQSAQLQASLESAGQGVERLQRMGWQVAERARALHQQLEQASTIAQELRAAGVTGPTFQDSIRTGGRLRSAVQSIPALFFSPEPDAVLEQADKATIIQVDEALSEQQPPLNELLSRMQAWKHQRDEALSFSEAYRQAVESLRSQLLNPPAGLDLDRMNLRLEQFEQSVADLRNRLAAPDADTLRALMMEARTGARTAQADLQAISTARQQIAELHNAIQAAGNQLKEIHRQMAEFETKERRPITWDTSRATLSGLQEQSKALGSVKQTRTPEQVARDLPVINSLREKARELDTAVKAGAGRYSQLLPLLDALDPKKNADRFASVRRLVAQASAYAPENWSRSDGAATFPADAGLVLQQIQQVVPPDPGAPLIESKLKDQLEMAQTTANRLTALQPRIDSIGKRLEAMHAQEVAAEDKLNQVIHLFNQVDLLAQENPVLAQVASRNDTEKLWQEGQRIADELFQESKRSVGTVEKKAARVDSWFKRVETQSNLWLNRLQAEARARREELVGKLDRLAQIAILEDPVMASARKFLEDNIPLDAPGAKPVNLPLSQVMIDLKRINDLWQRLVALLQEIEDEVESGVMEAYENALTQRQQTWERLESASRYLPDSPAWPPTLQNLQAERRSFDEAEAGWDALRSGPARANKLILQLSEIARAYQSVEDQVERTLERAESERDRIGVLEGTIAESIQMWQAQAGQNSQYPETREAVGRLVSETQASLDGLQRQFAQGKRTYQQVETELKAISRRINNALVPLEGGGSMDINGDVRVGNSYGP